MAPRHCNGIWRFIQPAAVHGLTPTFLSARLGAARARIRPSAAARVRPTHPAVGLGARAAEPSARGQRSFERARARKRSGVAGGAAPSGSAGNSARRRYILQRLSARGIAADVHITDAVVSLLGRVVAARVHNITARIPGSGRRGAVMLSAHYDTVRNAPGASDDGAGVATLLETAVRCEPARRSRATYFCSSPNSRP
jgi:Zn-dependent M28 family amino/carboxypeptidase